MFVSLFSGSVSRLLSPSTRCTTTNLFSGEKDFIQSSRGIRYSCTAYIQNVDKKNNWLFACFSYAEKVVRERFAKAVTRGLMELKIRKPTESPINGLIQNAVIEVCLVLLCVCVCVCVCVSFRNHLVHLWGRGERGNSENSNVCTVYLCHEDE